MQLPGPALRVALLALLPGPSVGGLAPAVAPLLRKTRVLRLRAKFKMRPRKSKTFWRVNIQP